MEHIWQSNKRNRSEEFLLIDYANYMIPCIHGTWIKALEDSAGGAMIEPLLERVITGSSLEYSTIIIV